MNSLKDYLNEQLAITMGDVMKLMLNLSVISYMFSLVLISLEIGDFELDDSVLQKYLISVYNSLVTITTVGYINYYSLEDSFILLVVMTFVFSGFFINGYML